MVDEIVVESFSASLEGDGFVYWTFGESGGGGEVGEITAEEAELGVRVKAAAADPTAEEEIAAADEEGVDFGVGG